MTSQPEGIAFWMDWTSVISKTPAYCSSNPSPFSVPGPTYRPTICTNIPSKGSGENSRYAVDNRADTGSGVIAQYVLTVLQGVNVWTSSLQK